MDIVFSTRRIYEKTITPAIAAKLFQKIWIWYSDFKIRIINDENIEIEKVIIEKADSSVFYDTIKITIQGKAYGHQINMYFTSSLSDILHPKKPKTDLGTYLTHRFIEEMKPILRSVAEQNNTISITMQKLGSE